MTLELFKTHGIFFRKGHFNKAVCSWVTPRLLWSDSGLISTLHAPTLRTEESFFFFFLRVGQGIRGSVQHALLLCKPPKFKVSYPACWRVV